MGVVRIYNHRLIINEQHMVEEIPTLFGFRRAVSPVMQHLN